MDKVPLSVGIDVAKRRLDVHLRPSGEGFAIDHYIGRAMILNPAAPPLYYRALGEVQFYAGAYGKAVEALRQAPLDNPEVLFFLAMAQAQTGAIEETRKAAERIRSEFPSFTVDSFIRDWPVTDADALAKLREGATKAGLLPVPVATN